MIHIAAKLSGRGAMCLLLAAISLWSNAPGDELYRGAASVLGVIVSTR
jgi:hypothetical protein